MSNLSNLSNLTIVEKGLKLLSSIISVPIFPLGFLSVKPNYSVVITRFGKVDRVIYQPGLRWTPIFCNAYEIFTGIQTKNIDNIFILDKVGMPMIISASINYRIYSPCKYIENIERKENLNEDNYDPKEQIIFNITKKYIRDQMSRNIFNCNNTKISENIKELVNEQINNFGVCIEEFNINEVKYPSEVMNIMVPKTEVIDSQKIKTIGLPEFNDGTREKIAFNLNINK
jgi:regulator of protease activity HflC (stomatin/prohibitin superfamily)